MIIVMLFSLIMGTLAAYLIGKHECIVAKQLLIIEYEICLKRVR